MPKGGFFKGDKRDSKAHWIIYASTWRWCSADCKNLYRIDSVDNDADELNITPHGLGAKWDFEVWTYDSDMALLL